MMVKKIVCANVGYNCSWKVEAETVEELLKMVAEHASHDHGMKHIPQETVKKVKNAIVDG
jgi:predicted small metal-binding protein